RNERMPGAVYHAPASATSFTSNSDLSDNDDFYVGASLVFTSGQMKDTARDITGYSGKTRTFTLTTPFPAAPADGDAFEIRGYNEKIVGTVANAPATAAGFISKVPLAPQDDYYVGSTLVFTSGELKGKARDI